MSSQDLQKMLAALRDEMQQAAPPRVEEALLAAFRAQAKARPRTHWMGWASAAAAAMIVAVGMGAIWIPKSVPPPPMPRAPMAKTPDPLPMPVVAKNVLKHTPRPRNVPKQQEEVTTQFLPLDDTLHLAPIESGQVLRVQVPRATLVRFGLPVNQERMMERIPADVVFGQDGIARAIRFVSRNE